LTALDVVFGIPQLARGGAGGVTGGPEGVILTLLQHLDRERVRPTLLLTEPGSNLLGELPDDVDVIEVRGRLPSARYPAYDVARALRRRRPDAVLTTLRMNSTIALADPLLPRSIPVICRVENHLSGTLANNRRGAGALKHRSVAALHRLTLRQADSIIAQSTSMRNDLVARFGPPVGDKVCVVPNPVDVEAVAQRADADVLDLERGHPQIVSVGRLHHQKGYDMLLASFASVLVDHPEARLWLIGEGEDRVALERRAEVLDIAHRVDLPGFVPNPLPLVRAADLDVCSSRYEGFSNALAEALALGTPAVAPAGPAAGADLITPLNGVLIDGASEALLAAGLSDALDRLDGFDRQAIAAQTAGRFAAGTVAERYADAIEGAVHGHRARR
jgi:glycosyltransferase involved in cell wall biosynthesis